VKSKPLLLGHRGCRNSDLARHNSNLPIENSLAAFEYALSQGCDGFEFDVRQTRDGRNVIWHDPYWNSTPITATDYARLTGSSGDWLPTLDDVLEQFGHRAFLDIELKVRGAEMSIVEALRAVPPQRGYMLSSFDPVTLIRLHNIDSSFPLGYICERDYALAIWRDIPIATVLPRFDLVQKELIDEMHRLGRKVATWTVNSESQMLQLADWGIDGLISDDPALLYRTFHNE
jgi:glycerophosphoryl diester phosphodiesterase